MIQQITKEIKECHCTFLRETCYCPVPPEEGSSLFSWMIIGEAPGETEDAEGKPFVGKSGQLLDYALESAGLERSQFTITNLVKCRPPSNRRPTNEEIQRCSPWLSRELEVFDPSVIIILGKTVYDYFCPFSSGVVNGTQFFIGSRTMVFFYHPSFWLRNGGRSYANKEIVPKLRELSQSWR